jgi:hypothetical protein
MEHLSLEALSTLFVLLPGFLCARIVQSLCVRPKQTELDKVVESLVYSFVIYLVFVWISGYNSPIGIVATAETGAQKHYSVEFRTRGLGELAVIALILAFLISWIETNDISGKLFRRFKLTQRTARSSIWSDVFHEIGGVVHVELGDGRRVMGWLRYYSDEPSDRSLFLERAAWVGPERKLIAVKGPGLLITQDLGVRWIEFLDTKEGDTAASIQDDGESQSWQTYVVIALALIGSCAIGYALGTGR